MFRRDGSGGKYQTDEEFYESCARQRQRELINEMRSEREWEERRDELSSTNISSNDTEHRS
jgi:hypothetical protein